MLGLRRVREPRLTWGVLGGAAQCLTGAVSVLTLGRVEANWHLDTMYWLAVREDHRAFLHSLRAEKSSLRR